LASHFGKLFRQPILASQFGGVLLQVNSADIQRAFKDEIKAKEKRSKLCIIP
jgi:hypothetical protein